jgi:hypothetical protein
MRATCPAHLIRLDLPNDIIIIIIINIIITVLLLSGTNVSQAQKGYV